MLLNLVCLPCVDLHRFHSVSPLLVVLEVPAELSNPLRCLEHSVASVLRFQHLRENRRAKFRSTKHKVTFLTVELVLVPLL